MTGGYLSREIRSTRPGKEGLAQDLRRFKGSAWGGVGREGKTRLAPLRGGLLGMRVARAWGRSYRGEGKNGLGRGRHAELRDLTGPNGDCGGGGFVIYLCDGGRCGTAGGSRPGPAD